MLNNITNYADLIDNRKVRTLLEASDLFTIGVRDLNFYGNYQPALITTTDLISSIAGLLPAPPVVDEVINFNQLTPTTPGVIFTPNSPGLTNVLYVSSVNTSSWIWNGTSYQTVPITNNTEWNFLGTSIDAGGNKSLAISRNNSIHTLGYDSYFNNVRVGTGGGNISSNTVVGNNSGVINSSGLYNSFFGYGTGAINTTGNYNTFIGYNSGNSNTTGISNSAIGFSSGESITVGRYNICFGTYAGRLTTSGVNNTFFGTSSGYFNTSGSQNLFLGKEAGAYAANGTTPITISNDSIFLGGQTKALADNQSNQIVIGHNTIGNGTNTVTIGNTSITDTYIKGIPHINNTWTLPITAPTAGKVLGYSAPGVSDWVSSSGANLQKEITATYVLTDADDDYTIFVNNGATAISISLGAITVPNFSVGFIQQGTADVTFVGVMTNPVGLKIKGQGYQVFIERKLSTALYYLLGNTKV